MDLKDILNRDDGFRYRLLSRMQQDCDYYLGNGNRNGKWLWARDEVNHIAYMKALWNSFSENEKPEWLSYEKILHYEHEMCPQAILAEQSLDDKISCADAQRSSAEFAQDCIERER